MKTLIVDNQEFSQKEVTLPTSVPLEKGRLVGFDFSFCKNREISCSQDAFYESLLELYSPDEISPSTNCDFYIIPIDLYIDLRLSQHHNFNAYNSKNKFHQKCLNELIENEKIDFIRQWCIKDVQKRKDMVGKKYLEVFNFKDIFNQIRRAVYSLLYNFDFECLKNSFYRVYKCKPSYKALSLNNVLIYKFQSHMIERERLIYFDPFLRRKHIENTCGMIFKKEEELTDIDILLNFRTSKRDCVPFGHFSPAIVKAFVEEFNIKSIYDPCAGWGHRLLGAWDIKYIYNDIDKRTYEGCKNIYNFCSKIRPSEKIFYNEDASEFTPTEEYECVFTCPPYFTRELYLCENTSTSKYPMYDDWLSIWWRNLIKCSIKSGVKFFAYVISDSLKEDMNKIVIEEGLVFHKEIPVGSNYQSHLIRNKSNRSNKESIQVFLTINK